MTDWTAYGLITDEQLTELSEHVGRTPNIGASDRVLRDCLLALRNTSIGYAQKHDRHAINREQSDARARCAQVYRAWKSPDTRK